MTEGMHERAEGWNLKEKNRKRDQGNAAPFLGRPFAGRSS